MLRGGKKFIHGRVQGLLIQNMCTEQLLERPTTCPPPCRDGVGSGLSVSKEGPCPIAPSRSVSYYRSGARQKKEKRGKGIPSQETALRMDGTMLNGIPTHKANIESVHGPPVSTRGAHPTRRSVLSTRSEIAPKAEPNPKKKTAFRNRQHYQTLPPHLAPHPPPLCRGFPNRKITLLTSRGKTLKGSSGTEHRQNRVWARLIIFQKLLCFASGHGAGRRKKKKRPLKTRDFFAVSHTHSLIPSLCSLPSVACCLSHALGTSLLVLPHARSPPIACERRKRRRKG